MSLILQALRKSEAQRQLGQAPSLLSAVPGPRARRSSGWRRAGYVLLLLLVALGAWWLGQRGQRDGSSPATDSGPHVVAPGADPIPVRTRLPATTLVIDNEPVPAHSPPPAPVVAPQRQSPEVPAPVEARAPATFAPVADPLPQLQEPAIPVATVPALPTLADLAPAERQGLPPLRITMHVFAEQPAQRFAIIDGHRVGEGALLGGGIVLAEITRAGVILDLHGRRVLVPRP